MSLKYLYSKFFKKVVRGKSILKSRIDKTSVVYSGCGIFNTTMGRYSYCGYDCELYSCDIGDFCSISDHVFIGGAEHPANWVSTSPVFQDTVHSGPTKRFAHLKTKPTKRTIIGDDVWIGHNVTVKQGVHIGVGAIIGAGSVVTKDIPPYAIAAGCPARIIRYRFPQETIDRLLESKWWKLSGEELESIGGFVDDPKSFLEQVSLLNGMNHV